jgi:phosphopantetheinyl transferase (holo-ACP synthase)
VEAQTVDAVPARPPAPAAARDRLLTLLWSAKESALKALGSAFGATLVR